MHQMITIVRNRKQDLNETTYQVSVYTATRKIEPNVYSNFYDSLRWVAKNSGGDPVLRESQLTLEENPEKISSGYLIDSVTIVTDDSESKVYVGSPIGVTLIGYANFVRILQFLANNIDKDGYILIR